MSEEIQALNNEERDVLGEIANISMGNAATTLSMMVNHPVDITTPEVSMTRRSESLDDFEKTCIFVSIRYVKGLSGSNVFILKVRDVMCMTDLMMGGDGTNTEGEPNELHLSAISEAMNQMMGTSATSMATMLDIPVDISTPTVDRIDVESVKKFEKMFESQMDQFVKVTFRMDIGDLVHSNMIQLYPLGFAKEMIEKFKANARKK